MLTHESDPENSASSALNRVGSRAVLGFVTLLFLAGSGLADPFLVVKGKTVRDGRFGALLRVPEAGLVTSGSLRRAALSLAYHDGDVLVYDFARGRFFRSTAGLPSYRALTSNGCSALVHYPGSDRFADLPRAQRDLQTLLETEDLLVLQPRVPIGGCDSTNGSISSPGDPPLDNTPPVANAGPDSTVQTAEATAQVDLLGTGTDQEDATGLTFRWTGNGQTLSGRAVRVTLPEGQHVFTFTVTDRVGASASDQVLVTVVRVTQPTLRISDSSVTEVDTGSNSTLSFLATLSATSTEPVTVNYSTSDVTAQAGVDYLSTSASLTFSPGQMAKTISVQVIGDFLDEDNESLAVTLSNLQGAVGSDLMAVGAILDDDIMAYVPSHVEGNLSVLDTSTDSIVDTIVLNDRGTGIAVSPAGDKVYMSDVFSTELLVHELGQAGVTRIPMPGNVEGPIVISPLGDTVYVGLQNAIAVVETATLNVAANVLVNGGLAPVNGLEIHPSGSTVYAASNFGRVFVLDTQSNTFAANPISIDNTGPLTGISIDAEGRGLRVSLMDSTRGGLPELNEIWAIPLDGDTTVCVEQTIVQPCLLAATSSAPGDLAVADSGFVFALLPAVGRVQTYNSAAGAVGSGLALGGTPRSLEINPQEDRLYITDDGADQIHVVDITNPASLSLIRTIQLAVDTRPIAMGHWFRRALPSVIPTSEDPDGDGIPSSLDGLMVGGVFVSEAMSFSNRFTDGDVGGSSFGQFSDRGSLDLQVQRSADGMALEVSAVSGSGVARLSSCGGPEVSLTNSDSVRVICASLHVEVLAGPVEIELAPGFILSVPATIQVGVSEEPDGSTSVVHEAGAPPLVLQLADGSMLTMPSSSSASYVFLPGGGVEIQNTGTPDLVLLSGSDTTIISSDESLELVNAQNPVADAGGPYLVEEGQSILLSGAGSSDPNLDPLTFEWDLDGNGTVDSTSRDVLMFAPNGSTSRPLRLTAIDSGGLRSVSDTILEIVNRAPSLDAILPSGQLIEGRGVLFTLQASDPGPIDVLRFAFDCDGDGVFERDLGTGRLVFCTFVDNGTFQVQAKVTDDEGLEGTLQSSIDVDNGNPFVSTFGDGVMPNEGSPVTLVASASDPGGVNDPLTFEFDCDDDGVFEVGPISSSSVECTFDDNGVFSVAVRVRDDDGGETTTGTSLVVDNLPPIISEVMHDGPVLGGEGAVITIVASDPAGVNDPLMYEFDCDDDGDYEIGPQSESSAFCIFPRIEPSTSTPLTEVGRPGIAARATFDSRVAVRVSDDDEGVATSSVLVPVIEDPLAIPTIGMVGATVLMLLLLTSGLLVLRQRP